MSETMKIVIPGARGVHDGLGNKLAGTVTDPRTGQIISQPEHTVPSMIGHLLCGSGMAKMVTGAPEAPQAPVEPPAAPVVPASLTPPPVASPETPAAAPATEGSEVGGVEAGIAEAEAEAAPATEAEKATAEAEAGDDVAAELEAAAETPNPADEG